MTDRGGQKVGGVGCVTGRGWVGHATVAERVEPPGRLGRSHSRGDVSDCPGTGPICETGKCSGAGSSPVPIDEASNDELAADGWPPKFPPPASSAPTIAEWNAVTREVTVWGSSALKCETKMVREWLRISCRANHLGVPLAVSHQPAFGQQALRFVAEGSVASVVLQMSPGKDYDATFTWGDAAAREVAQERRAHVRRDVSERGSGVRPRHGRREVGSPRTVRSEGTRGGAAPRAGGRHLRSDVRHAPDRRVRYAPHSSERPSPCNGRPCTWYPHDMERRSMTSWTATRDARFEYERPPRPIFFPEEELVPETKRHLALRTLLFAVLERAFGDRAAIGSDQFVYFHAADPRRCVAPDVFVRLDAENDLFPTWKVWERGAPDVAIEIGSDHERPWADKLVDYQQLGVRELVRFDPEAPAGVRLRVWDRVHEDLVPRLVAGERAASRVLGGTWCVAPGDNVDVALRLEDASGALLPTTAEAEKAERQAKEAERARADAERQEKEAERAAKEAERARADALEAQVAALLAERGRSGS